MNEDYRELDNLIHMYASELSMLSDIETKIHKTKNKENLDILYHYEKYHFEKSSEYLKDIKTSLKNYKYDNLIIHLNQKRKDWTEASKNDEYLIKNPVIWGLDDAYYHAIAYVEISRITKNQHTKNSTKHFPKNKTL